MYQSPVAAVAEIVSNSWDADAETVAISLPNILDDTAEIIIRDDGLGMTFDQCQSRFLEVGYDRRSNDPRAKSPNKHRPVLGRKGIGKFAGFGIAGIIQVETVSGDTGEKTIFALDADKLRGNEYVGRDEKIIDVIEYLSPDESRRANHGTTIRLQRLALRQRPSEVVFGRSMARRFLLNQRAADFKVTVNGKELPNADGLEKIQFIFPRDYQAQELAQKLTVNEDGSGTETIGSNSIRWRFVFYEEPIDDEELRGVSVFAHGKLAQSPFIFNLVGGLGGQQGIEYLSGMVEADYLDELTTDIIAPERQRIDWNKEEAAPLLEWGQARVKSLLRIWQARRAEKKYELLSEKLSPLAERLDKLPRHERKIIEGAIRRFAAVPRVKEDTFLDLSHAMLTAWEGGRLKDLIATIAESDELSSDQFIDILMEAKVLTALHTAEAVKAKLLIIQGLEQRIRQRELELAVRDYIADNPWLISPQWETFQIERGIAHVIRDAAAEAMLDTIEDWKGRVDLVLSSGDTLLVVEFMRPGLRIDWDHVNRFDLYVTAIRTRVQANSAGLFRRVAGGYLVADRLNETPTLLDRLRRLEVEGMKAIEWETLLRQAEAQWKEFVGILVTRAPQDERVQALRLTQGDDN